MMACSIDSREQPGVIDGIDRAEGQNCHDCGEYTHKIESGYLTPSAPSESPLSSPLAFEPRSLHPFDRMAYTPDSTTASTTQRVISSGSETTIEPNPLEISLPPVSLFVYLHVDDFLALLVCAVDELDKAVRRGPLLLLFCRLVCVLKEPISLSLAALFIILHSTHL